MVSADEARYLDRLAVGTSARVRPGMTGSRLNRSRGLGSERHDFRPYQPGDDPRTLEWTISARLGQLVVRTHRATASLRVYLMVDISRSMTSGLPTKFACATRLAALLAYVAIGAGDAAGLATFDDRVRLSIPAAAGRQQLHRLIQALASMGPGATSALSRGLIGFGDAHAGPGLVVILSDFFDPAGPWEGLRYLLYRGLTPAVVQILCPDELDPSFDETVELVDIEDPQGRALIVTPDVVAHYRSRLADLTASLGEFCLSRGCPWLQLSTTAAFGDLVEACQQAGLLTERT